MKKSRFTESQIVAAIKQHKSGRKANAICREYGISKKTFYLWRKKYSGMDALQLKCLKELEDENRKLKQMFADVSLDNKMLKDVLSKPRSWSRDAII